MWYIVEYRGDRYITSDLDEFPGCRVLHKCQSYAEAQRLQAGHSFSMWPVHIKSSL